MNYYEHHIGDYLKDTARLSLPEHGAYLVLLSDYYGNEKPLPADYESLYRIARAMSKSEQAAVRSVADAFFKVAADGLRHNKRADEELEKAASRMDGSENRRANERERQKRARERRKALFEQLREAGVTPKFDATTQELEELVTRHITHNVTPDVTRDITANQTPHATHQTPEEQKNQSSLRSDSPSAGADGGAVDSAAAEKPKPPGRVERLTEVTRDAIAAFNAKLGKPHGVLPAVNASVGIEKRRDQVKRCLRVARQICQQQFGDPHVTPAFWRAYWVEVDRDDFKSGRQEPGRGHENWTPNFEYLTREVVMLDVFDRAAARKAE